MVYRFVDLHASNLNCLFFFLELGVYENKKSKKGIRKATILASPCYFQVLASFVFFRFVLLFLFIYSSHCTNDCILELTEPIGRSREMYQITLIEFFLVIIPKVYIYIYIRTCTHLLLLFLFFFSFVCFFGR